MAKVVNVYFSKSDWSSAYDFWWAEYESGKVRTFDNFHKLSKNVKEYIKSKSMGEPKRDRYEQCTTYRLV